MRTWVLGFSVLVVLAAATSCGGDDESNGGSGGGAGTSGSGGAGGSPDNTGSTCATADDCYPGVTGLSGEPRCLDRVRGGYCTHLCETDDDCCAAEGECRSDLAQVCSPFESTGVRQCFLSCEAEDIRRTDGGAIDEQEFCQRFASRDFICRSSGGGSANRKVCLPGTCGVGAACAGDGDCASGLTCVTALRGGYCSRTGCTANSDCPGENLCVRDGAGGTYCARPCRGASDCSFCRGTTAAATCSETATLADGTAAPRVCVP